MFECSTIRPSTTFEKYQKFWEITENFLRNEKILVNYQEISQTSHRKNMVAPVENNFVVADHHLIAPVMLGTHFLRQYELMLDFSVRLYAKQVQAPQLELQSFWKKTVIHKPHIGTVAVLGDMAVEATEEYAIPDYGAVTENSRGNYG